MTGTVASIQRHPLKSHGREELAAVRLTAGAGLPWDRHWAVAHDAAQITEGAWAECANFSRGSKAPKLMAINARLEEGAGRLHLTHPQRPDICFCPDDRADLPRFLDWVMPLCPPDRALPQRISSAPGRGMTDTDYPSVSLINLASNQALAEQMGCNLSPLRWRANLWISGWDAFAERDLIGRQIAISTAVLEVIEPKERCLATTANPATGERDADTLAALRARFGDQNFGLYAKVIRTGDVTTGAPVEVLA
ncbi:MAG: MOSC domain-containing protein [Rhodobacteraceae bacterium]|nr:MOSC domain-containing protein [Paracoccaceae bacterium]